eukprot:348255-Alexandrium_andersonii.AAC.1
MRHGASNARLSERKAPRTRAACCARAAAAAAAAAAHPAPPRTPRATREARRSRGPGRARWLP